MFCANLAFFVVFLPFALLLSGDSSAYFVAVLLIGVALGPALIGWLFEVFAARSSRIVVFRPPKGEPV